MAFAERSKKKTERLEKSLAFNGRKESTWMRFYIGTEVTDPYQLERKQP